MSVAYKYNNMTIGIPFITDSGSSAPSSGQQQEQPQQHESILNTDYNKRIVTLFPSSNDNYYYNFLTFFQ